MISQETVLRFIKNGWWLILLAVIAAAGSAALLATVATPIYESSARYVISPNRATLTDEGDIIYGIDALSRRSTVATYVEIFQSDRVIDGAAATLNLSPATMEAYDISAVVLPETSVVHVAVIGPSPMIVQKLAAAVGDEAVTYIRDLYDVYAINLLDIAKVPQLPISPNLPRSTALAAALGLMVGILLALFRTPEILSSPALPSAATAYVTPPGHTEKQQPEEADRYAPYQPPQTVTGAATDPTYPVRQRRNPLKRPVPQQFSLIESASEEERFQLPHQTQDGL